MLGTSPNDFMVAAVQREILWDEQQEQNQNLELKMTLILGIPYLHESVITRLN